MVIPLTRQLTSSKVELIEIESIKLTTRCNHTLRWKRYEMTLIVDNFSQYRVTEYFYQAYASTMTLWLTLRQYL